VPYDIDVPVAGASRATGTTEVQRLQAIEDALNALDTAATTAYTPGGSDVAVADGGTGASTAAAARTNLGVDAAGTNVPKATFPVVLGFAISDETTAITTGAAKLTARAPFAFTLTAVRASLTTASSSGIPTFDINEGGTTVLSTKLTIDANEKTSTTAATPAVISDSAIADDAELTFDIDVAGTGAAGAKVWLLGTRVIA
jgi:hypothetical protein